MGSTEGVQIKIYSSVQDLELALQREGDGGQGSRPLVAWFDSVVRQVARAGLDWLGSSPSHAEAISAIHQDAQRKSLIAGRG